MQRFKIAEGFDGVTAMVRSDDGEFVKFKDAEKMVKMLRRIQVEHCNTAELYNLIDDLLDEIRDGE